MCKYLIGHNVLNALQIAALFVEIFFIDIIY